MKNVNIYTGQLIMLLIRWNKVIFIATDYGLDDRGSNLSRGKISLFFRPGVGPMQPNGYRGRFSRV
jgi:hypothetical protein